MKKMEELPTEIDNDEELEKDLGDPDMFQALRIRLETITPENGYIEWFRRHRRAVVGLGELSLAATGFATGGIFAAHHH